MTFARFQTLAGLTLAIGILVAGCGGSGAKSGTGGSSTAKQDVAGVDRIRKQVYDLRPSDLEQFPIWEHALDEEGAPGQDEATVKPRPDLDEADPGEGMLIVRAEFTAKSRYGGFVYPSFEPTVGLIQPTIVTDGGQVSFWYGVISPKRADVQHDYTLLGTTGEQLFPLEYRVLVPHRGAKLAGSIPAFLHLRAIGSDEVVQVK